jgi:hypothetical protein
MVCSRPNIVPCAHGKGKDLQYLPSQSPTSQTAPTTAAPASSASPILWSWSDAVASFPTWSAAAAENLLLYLLRYLLLHMMLYMMLMLLPLLMRLTRQQVSTKPLSCSKQCEVNKAESQCNLGSTICQGGFKSAQATKAAI